MSGPVSSGPEVAADGSTTAPGGRAADGTPLPRIIARPELLEADPLPPLSTGRGRLIFGGIVCVVLAVTGLLMGGANWTMGLVGLGFWGFMAAFVWADRRAFMQATAGMLRVRNVWRVHELHGEQVRRVVHQYNGRSPDFQLVTDTGKVWVPASRLERGHSTLFSWLDVHAPQAVVERRAARWRQALVDEGAL
ncbi:hypothetical protein ACQCX5_05485 [Propionibacteriaceae bacterium G57]|uniref:hypothetical protein n=1 Tax=Aestuariimicrobium sp. G57 TaxID=3418485 RepID=UPI003DA7733D